MRMSFISVCDVYIYVCKETIYCKCVVYTLANDFIYFLQFDYHNDFIIKTLLVSTQRKFPDRTITPPPVEINQEMHHNKTVHTKYPNTKQCRSSFKQRVFLPISIEPFEKNPIFNYAFQRIFYKIETNNRAIFKRGWGSLNWELFIIPNLNEP